MDRPTWGGTKASVCPPCERDVMEVDYPDPVEHSDDCSVSQHLDYNVMRDCQVRFTSQTAPEFLIHTNCV